MNCNVYLLWRAYHILLRSELMGQLDLLYALEHWNSLHFLGRFFGKANKKYKQGWKTNIFSGSASSSSACRGSSYLAIRTFWVLLLHMSVERGIAKIRLVAVFALEISTIHIVLWAPLRFAYNHKGKYSYYRLLTHYCHLRRFWVQRLVVDQECTQVAWMRHWNSHPLSASVIIGSSS